MTVSRTLLLCWALLVALSIGTVLTGAAGLWLVVLLLAEPISGLLQQVLTSPQHFVVGAHVAFNALLLRHSIDF